MPEALPVPVLPSAWRQGHCQLGLPVAGQAPFAWGRGSSTKHMEGCRSPLATVWLSGKHLGCPSTSPCPQRVRAGADPLRGTKSRWGWAAPLGSPGLPLLLSLGSEAGALVVQPAELGEATVPAVRVPAGTPCQSPAPRPAPAPAAAAAAGAAAAGAAAAAPVLVDGDLDLGPAKDHR